MIREQIIQLFGLIWIFHIDNAPLVRLRQGQRSLTYVCEGAIIDLLVKLAYWLVNTHHRLRRPKLMLLEQWDDLADLSYSTLVLMQTVLGPRQKIYNFSSGLLRL